MTDVYVQCPQLNGPTLTLRPTCMEDAEDLLLVYGDEGNTPFFNSDNCTNNFYFPTLKEMQACIGMWLRSYARKDFVRWSIVEGGRAIGTIECFHRIAEDAFTDCALLRIDLRRDRDTLRVNNELLDMLLPRLKEFFGSSFTATKAPSFAEARIAALTEHGFVPAAKDERYHDYWTLPL